MEFKEDGTVTVDRIKKKKIKCCKFKYKPLNRYLMLHADIDNKDFTTLSDFATGYRLFKLQVKPEKLDKNELKDKLEKYISHFTIEGIQEEIKRLQEIEEASRKK